MIIYSKTLWGFPLLTRVYGSALPRSLLPALLSGLITLWLLLLREQMQHLWLHPYPYQPLVLIATFVLTFRSNYAYQRHWEAYTQVQTMTARWLDATVQLIMFDRHPQPPGGKLPSPASHHQFVAELVHLMSLMHATCCAALRRDPDVANLVPHSRLAEAPPTDPAQLNLQRGSMSSAPGSPRGAAAAGRRGSGEGFGGSGSPRGVRRRSLEGPGSSGSGISRAISPPARHRGAEASPFAAVAGSDGSSEASAAGEATAAAEGSGSSSGRWTALGSALPFYRQGEYSIVGAANWRDIFMLRGSPLAIAEYNIAQPLPVVGGVTKQELAVLGCKLHQRSQQEEAAAVNGQTLDSVDEHGVYNRQQQQQQYEQKSRPSTADTAAVRDSGHGAKGMWGMLRHRSGTQSQSDGVAVADNMQQQRPVPGPRASSDADSSSITNNTLGQGGRSSSNGLRLRPLVQLSGYFDIAALSSKLQSARSVERSGSGAPAAQGGVAGPSNASKLQRQPSSNLKPNVASQRRFKVSLNHTCCWAHLPYMDRPLLLLSWVHELMLQRQSAGGLRTPAPILARVHACLSDGLVAYEQCRKLADTPFPFPWAQFVLVMLVLFTLTLPLLVVAYVQNSVIAVVLCVCTTSTFWTVNEVARDVEDAFIMEPNNMPLANTQFHFNELLLTLSVAERPASGVVPVVLPMPPGMRLPGSIRAVGTAGDLAAAAAAAAEADVAGLQMPDTTRPPGPTVPAAAAAAAGGAATPVAVNGPASAVAKFGVPASPSAAAAAASFDAPYGVRDVAHDASPRSSRPGDNSSSSTDTSAALQQHQLQQHQDQLDELQQQQQQQPLFQFQTLKPLVVRRSGTFSSISSTEHGTPRFASDPGVQPAAAAADSGSAVYDSAFGSSAADASSAAADAGQYSVIPGHYNVEQYNTDQQQQYSTWDDDVSSTPIDGESMHADADAGDFEVTGTAAARAALFASAASNVQSMEAFTAGAAVADAPAAGVLEDAAGVSGWEQQPASTAGNDDMV